MALWTPSQITTALWLDAADASTLYDATSGGSLVAADGTVARWEDKSGNVRHVTQATSGNRPLRKTAYEGGVDSILFDGSNDAIALAANLSIGTHTVFVVARNTATITSATTAQVLLSGGSYTYPSTTTSEWLFCAGSLTGNLTNERLLNVVVAHAATAQELYGNGKTNADVSTGIIGVSSYSPGGTLVARLNGQADYATASSVGSFSNTNTRYPTLLRGVGNRFSNTSAHWSGTISEVVVSASVLSASDIEKVEGYLAHKWGMTANLPGSHPYKTVAPRAYKYPSLRTTAPVAGYYARLDAGAAATDQFTADGAQDGTLTNGASRAGSPLAYSFDGSNDYVEFGSSAILGGSGSIAIASWANATSLPLAANVIFSKMHTEGGTNQVAYLIAVLSNGRIYFATTNGGGGGVQEWQSSSTVISTGVWFHIAVTYTWGTGSTIQVYLNGSLVAGSWTTGNGNVTFTGASGPKQKIGRMQHTGVTSFFSWTGLIDDLLLWNAIIDATNIGYLASQRGAIYQLLAGSSLINGQSLIRPADSKPYQQLIGV